MLVLKSSDLFKCKQKWEQKWTTRSYARKIFKYGAAVLNGDGFNK